MKEARLKEGRKVCLSSDNRAPVYKILSVGPNGGVTLIAAGSRMLIYHPERNTHIFARHLEEATTQQLDHAKLTRLNN